MRQAIIWINADPIHWRIYTALEGDELNLRVFVIYYRMLRFQRDLLSLM